jgi:hypothetical protein
MLLAMCQALPLAPPTHYPLSHHLPTYHLSRSPACPPTCPSAFPPPHSAARPDLLPKPYLDALSDLQDRLPSFPSSIAFQLIAEELGRPVDEVYSEITPEPVAAASLGQVCAQQFLHRHQQPQQCCRVRGWFSAVPAASSSMPCCLHCILSALPPPLLPFLATLAGV